MEFIKGKWYKSNHGGGTCHTGYYYLKITRIDDGILFGEKISSNSYTEKDTWDYPDTLGQALELGPLTDLSEIQPYLPEGHPDKQFVLPENWHVLVTEENLEELRRWSGIEVNTTDLCGIVKWFNPIRFKVSHNTKGIIKETGPLAYDFGQEITYE